MLNKENIKSLVKYVFKESPWTTAFIVSIVLFLLCCMVEYFLFIPLRMGFTYFVMSICQFILGWFAIETWFDIYDEWCKERLDYE